MILSGSPLDYIVVFLGGVLVSFTPCVYPLIPISAGFIGIESGGSKLRGFLLSLSYVTGVAITYSILGLFAALTGTFFGKVSSSPLTYFIVGTVIIAFGFSMLGLFIIPLAANIKSPAFKRKNYFSAFLLGLSSGAIASPCLTPVLGSILAYLATKKNVLYGATLLFVFAYGMGLLLILVGTFSAILANLPKSGKWLVYVKKLAALLLIAMGVYFVYIGMRRR